jgi:hypothetical protein
MPFNGQQIYSKPAGTTAAPNTTIESAKFNEVVDDLVNAINYQRPGYLVGFGEAVWKATKALLDADLTHAADMAGVVYADTTAANNGVYVKSGASGAGSWTRKTDLPYSFIPCVDSGAGTANAIQLVADLTPPTIAGTALFLANVFEANTGAVMVSINGATAKSLKTKTGNALAAGYLAADDRIMFVDDGTDYRLTSDVVASSVLAGAEAAAIAAANSAAGIASAVAGLSAFKATLADAIADDPISDPEYYEISYFDTSYQAGSSARYRKRASEPAHTGGKFQNANGIWYQIDEPALTPEMLGVVGDWNGSSGTDNATAFTSLLAAHSALEVPIRMTGGKEYYTSTSLATNEDWVNIEGDFTCKIVTDATTGTILSIGASRAAVATKAVTANITLGGKILTVADTTGLEAGMICHLQSSKAWYNDPRTDDDVTTGAFSVTSGAGSTTTAVLDASFAVTGSLVGKAITFLSGSNNGYSRVVTAYDSGTKTATFAALPASVASGVTYRFPQLFKGQTHKVARVINGTTFETEDSNRDGYHVQDGTAANVKEVVTLNFYEAYSPRVKGVVFEGPDVSADTFGVSVRTAVNPDIDVKTINCRRGGLVGSYGYGGDFRNQPSGASDVSTGYGIQVSAWGGSPKLVARGFGNRRVIDVSGLTPSDDARIDAVCFGGGLQEDGSAYLPIGAVSNYAVGTHGAARGTIYERIVVSNCEYAVYERGRNAQVKSLVIGPNVRVPVFHSFGGAIDIEDVTVDGRLFGAVDLTGLEEAADFAGDAGDVYPDCLLVVGANLLAKQPESRIVVRGNTARVKKNLVQFDNTGTATMLNLSVFDNDVEFYPDSGSDDVALFGKATGAASNTVSIRGDVLGPNRMRSSTGSKLPVLYGPEIVFSTTSGTYRQFGNGVFSMALSDDTAGALPIAQKGTTKLMLTVTLEETASFYFHGVITADSATHIQFNGAFAQVLATAPTGASSTDGRLQIHFTPGTLTIGNRCGGTRTFNVIAIPFG